MNTIQRYCKLALILCVSIASAAIGESVKDQQNPPHQLSGPIDNSQIYINSTVNNNCNQCRISQKDLKKLGKNIGSTILAELMKQTEHLIDSVTQISVKYYTAPLREYLFDRAKIDDAVGFRARLNEVKGLNPDTVRVQLGWLVFALNKDYKNHLFSAYKNWQDFPFDVYFQNIYRITKRKPREFDSLSFGGIHFEDAFLKGMHFNHSIEIKNHYDRAYLSNSNFSQALLEQCSFQNTDLTGSKFVDAVITSSTFQNADLDNADFSGADLRSADIKYARNLSNIRFDEKTKFSSDIFDSNDTINSEERNKLEHRIFAFWETKRPKSAFFISEVYSPEGFHFTGFGSEDFNYSISSKNDTAIFTTNAEFGIQTSYLWDQNLTSNIAVIKTSGSSKDSISIHSTEQAFPAVRIAVGLKLYSTKYLFGFGDFNYVMRPSRSNSFIETDSLHTFQTGIMKDRYSIDHHLTWGVGFGIGTPPKKYDDWHGAIGVGASCFDSDLFASQSIDDDSFHYGATLRIIIGKGRYETETGIDAYRSNYSLSFKLKVLDWHFYSDFNREK